MSASLGAGSALTALARSLGKSSLCPVAVAVLLAASGSAGASALYSGQVSGLFLEPVARQGVHLLRTHVSEFLDNTTTAVYSGIGTNSFHWGANEPDTAVPESVLTFTGSPFVDVAPETEFMLGTLSYVNGSSLAETLVFDVGLSFSIAGSAASIDAANVLVEMWATQNGNADPAADADYITFDVLPIEFHIFEGHTATVDVFGSIHGDPWLTVDRIALAPGDAGGFVVPVPGTLALLVAGMVGLGMRPTRLTGTDLGRGA